MDPVTPRARRDGLVVHELSEDLLVYDLERDETHWLNDGAAHVWKRCDGEATIAAIAASLPSVGDRGVAEDTVRHALDQLAESNLLDDAPPPSGITRGQLVRRAGVAAAVALPLVSSIVAPTAAEAGTPGPTGPTGPTGATGPTGP